MLRCPCGNYDQEEQVHDCGSYHSDNFVVCVTLLITCLAQEYDQSCYMCWREKRRICRGKRMQGQPGSSDTGAKSATARASHMVAGHETSFGPSGWFLGNLTTVGLPPIFPSLACLSRQSGKIVQYAASTLQVSYEIPGRLVCWCCNFSRSGAVCIFQNDAATGPGSRQCQLKMILDLHLGFTDWSTRWYDLRFHQRCHPQNRHRLVAKTLTSFRNIKLRKNIFTAGSTDSFNLSWNNSSQINRIGVLMLKTY